MRFKMQNFNAVANQAASSLLFLSCIGVVIPTAAGWLLGGSGVSDAALLSISRGTAVVLLTL
jgi:Ca2+/H+ antiporter